MGTTSPEATHLGTRLGKGRGVRVGPEEAGHFHLLRGKDVDREEMGIWGLGQLRGLGYLIKYRVVGEAEISPKEIDEHAG